MDKTNSVKKNSDVSKKGQNCLILRKYLIEYCLPKYCGLLKLWVQILGPGTARQLFSEVLSNPSRGRWVGGWVVYRWYVIMPFCGPKILQKFKLNSNLCLSFQTPSRHLSDPFQLPFRNLWVTFQTPL